MKMFLILALIFFSFNLKAETIFKCNVSPLGDSDNDNVKANGHVEVRKEDGIYTVYTKVSFKDDEGGEENVEGSEVATFNLINEDTQPTVSELLADNDEVVEFLLKKLNGEKPVEFRQYVGEGFEDIAGLGVLTLVGNKGATATLVVLGWVALFCE